MTFKRIRFEAIPEEAQNNCEVPDEMAKYAKKYFKKYVNDKELKDSFTLNSPLLTNLPKAKNMDDYFAELLKDQRKKEIALDDTFKKLQSKILTIMGPLSKVWYTLEESLDGRGGFVSFKMSKYSRGQSTSSQPSQGSQTPWKSKRTFGKSFLNKEGNLS